MYDISNGVVGDKWYNINYTNDKQGFLTLQAVLAAKMTEGFGLSDVQSLSALWIYRCFFNAYTYLFCVGKEWCAWSNASVGVRGQPTGAGSLIPPRRPQGWSLGGCRCLTHQAMSPAPSLCFLMSSIGGKY